MENVWNACAAEELCCDTMAMQQHPHFFCACRALGTDADSLALRSEGGIQASAVMLHHRRHKLGQFSLVSRGPVWASEPDAAQSRHAMRALARHGSGRARILLASPGAHSSASMREAGFIAAQTPATTAVLRLHQSESHQAAQMSVKWRNRLRKAQSTDLEVRTATLPDDSSHWLLRAESDQRQKRGYRALPPSFAAAWSHTNPGTALVLEASRSGERIAAMLILLHPPGASYFIGWSAPDGRRQNAHNLLLWVATRLCIENGCEALDLGLLDTVRTPGLARFKIGSGAESFDLGPTWMRAPFTPVFARFSASARIRR